MVVSSWNSTQLFTSTFNKTPFCFSVLVSTTFAWGKKHYLHDSKLFLCLYIVSFFSCFFQHHPVCSLCGVRLLELVPPWIPILLSAPCLQTLCVSRFWLFEDLPLKIKTLLSFINSGTILRQQSSVGWLDDLVHTIINILNILY